ncbi:hypothetical protein VTH82DRAFT_3787 [Thermothelomyces myriococcoides]
MATGVDAKLLKSTKFPPEFNQKVDMQKVNIQVMKKWIANRVTELLGNEDDVVIELIFNLIEGARHPDIKSIQIQLTGFLDKDTPAFCKELWKLLLSAQASPQGVPKELLEAKKLELMQEKMEADRAAEEARLRREEFERRDRGRGGRGGGGGGGPGRGGDSWRGRDDRNRGGIGRGRSRSPPRFRERGGRGGRGEPRGGGWTRDAVEVPVSVSVPNSILVSVQIPHSVRLVGPVDLVTHPTAATARTDPIPFTHAPITAGLSQAVPVPAWSWPIGVVRPQLALAEAAPLFTIEELESWPEPEPQPEPIENADSAL